MGILKTIGRYEYTIFMVLFFSTGLFISPILYETIDNKLMYMFYALLMGVLFTFLIYKSVNETKNKRNER